MFKGLTIVEMTTEEESIRDIKNTMSTTKEWINQKNIQMVDCINTINKIISSTQEGIHFKNFSIDSEKEITIVINNAQEEGEQERIITFFKEEDELLKTFHSRVSTAISEATEKVISLRGSKITDEQNLTSEECKKLKIPYYEQKNLKKDLKYNITYHHTQDKDNGKTHASFKADTPKLVITEQV